MVRDTLRGVVAGRRVRLGHAFLVPGSDTVRVDGVVLPRSAYAFNPVLGTLRIDVPVSPDALVVVTARREPIAMPARFARRGVEPGVPGEGEPREPNAGVPALGTRSAPAREPPRRLHFGGSKSVSFTVGSNRGASLDQTLQASIEGEVAEGIRVRALLSDNNLPVQPEGNTETLEYFDQVFVEITGRRARASLGDVTVRDTLSSFSRITRDLRGVSVAAWRGPRRRGDRRTPGARAMAVGATTKGEYRRAQFRGRTGLQGPYDLLPVSRAVPEVIIAGSERVFVDGMRMRRGRNRDYVIDYDRGTITFTPAREITDETEISVDFQVTNERYDRSTIVAGVDGVALGGGFEAGFRVAREADDVERPKQGALGDVERAALEAAGDDAARARAPGAVAVAPGSGDYVLVPADSLSGVPAHFAFDDSLGDWQVSFVPVTPGRGAYRFAGISASGARYYEFVPDSSGSWDVGRRVPLPSRHSLVVARVQRRDGRVRVDAEWNTSDLDRNVLSPLDDGDNVGSAARATIRLGLGRRSVGHWPVSLHAAASRLDASFASFDRVRPGFYYRNWALEDTARAADETLFEVGGEMRLERTRLGTTWERLERGAFQGDRLRGSFMLSAGRRRHRLGGFRTRIEAPGEVRRRDHAELATGWSWTAVLVDGDRFAVWRAAAPDTGYAWTRARVNHFQPLGFGAAFLEVEWRRADALDPFSGTWARARTEQAVSTQWRIEPKRSPAVRGELRVSHRESDVEGAGRTTSDLARVRMTFYVRGVGLRSDVDYEISRDADRTLVRSVVFVGEGNGDYDAQGDVVGKGRGAYMLVFAPTDELVPVSRVSLNLRTVWKPRGSGRDGRRRGGLGGWIQRNVSMEQTLGVVERTRFSPAWKVYALVPSALQRDDATRFGSVRLRQDWSLLDDVPNASLVVRVRRDDTEDNRFEGVRENRLRSELAARLTRSLSSGWSATAELRRRIDRRNGPGLGSGTGRTFDVVEHAAVVGAGVRPLPGTSIDVDATVLVRDDGESGGSQRALDVSPRAVARLGRRLSVFARASLRRTWETEAPPVRPTVFDLPGYSARWTLSPTLRLARSVSLVVTYTGRSERAFSGARIVDHQLRMETRATF